LRDEKCRETSGLFAAAEEKAEHGEDYGYGEEYPVGGDGLGIHQRRTDDGNGEKQDGIAPPVATQWRVGFRCFALGDEAPLRAGGGDDSKPRCGANGV